MTFSWEDLHIAPPFKKKMWNKASSLSSLIHKIWVSQIITDMLMPLSVHGRCVLAAKRWSILFNLYRICDSLVGWLVSGWPWAKTLRSRTLKVLTRTILFPCYSPSLIRIRHTIEYICALFFPLFSFLLLPANFLKRKLFVKLIYCKPWDDSFNDCFRW